MMPLSTLSAFGRLAISVSPWYMVEVPTIRIDWPEGLVHERFAPAHRYASLPLAMAQAAWLSTLCGTALVSHHGATVAYYVQGSLSL